MTWILQFPLFSSKVIKCCCHNKFWSCSLRKMAQAICIHYGEGHLSNPFIICAHCSSTLSVTKYLQPPLSPAFSLSDLVSAPGRQLCFCVLLHISSHNFWKYMVASTEMTLIGSLWSSEHRSSQWGVDNFLCTMMKSCVSLPPYMECWEKFIWSMWLKKDFLSATLTICSNLRGFPCSCSNP